MILENVSFGGFFCYSCARVNYCDEIIKKWLTYNRTSLYQIFNRSNLKSGLHFLSSSYIHVLLANCYLDTVLTNNVIATYKVTSHADCLFHCSENERCKSYNYQHKLTYSTEGKLGLCELNSKRMNSCPLRKVRKEGHDYFEEVNVPEKDKVYCKYYSLPTISFMGELIRTGW